MWNGNRMIMKLLIEVESRKLMIFQLILFLINWQLFANHLPKLISCISLFCISHILQNTPKRKLKWDNIGRLLRDHITLCLVKPTDKVFHFSFLWILKDLFKRLWSVTLLHMELQCWKCKNTESVTSFITSVLLNSSMTPGHSLWQFTSLLVKSHENWQLLLSVKGQISLGLV